MATSRVPRQTVDMVDSGAGLVAGQRRRPRPERPRAASPQPGADRDTPPTAPPVLPRFGACGPGGDARKIAPIHCDMAGPPGERPHRIPGPRRRPVGATGPWTPLPEDRTMAQDPQQAVPPPEEVVPPPAAPAD